MAARYSKRADFRIIYVHEAHPADGWQVPQNRRAGIEVGEPKTIQERMKVAAMCETALQLKIPIAVDDMDDAVERAYAGWPDRIYVVDKEGKIAFALSWPPKGTRSKLYMNEDNVSS